jgi:hypothetical protein
MKRWLAVLGVLLAGALLLPQHAWSQGAIVNNGLQLQGTPLSIEFVQRLKYRHTPAGIAERGTQPGRCRLAAGRYWFRARRLGLRRRCDGERDVPECVDIQLKTGVVGSTEIADGSIVDADIASNAGIAVSKLAVTQNYLIVGDASGQGSLLAPGSTGQVLTIDASGAPTWQTLSGTVPNGSAANQLLRWNNSTNAWEAVDLTAGTGISITHSGTAITVTNTGDTDASDDLTTSTSFSAAAGSDATVSGTYNALDIQLKTGVVGSTEIADGTIVDADIASNAGIAVSKLAVTQNYLIVGDASGQGSLLAPGTTGQVLTIDASGAPTWQTLSGTVPNGSAANQLLRWNNSTNAWEAVNLTAGTGISITHNGTASP